MILKGKRPLTIKDKAEQKHKLNHSEISFENPADIRHRFRILMCFVQNVT